MNVILTVTSIADESAGPSYTVPALGEALKRAGANVELHTLDSLPRRELRVPVVTYRRTVVPLLSHMGWSLPMYKGLLRRCSTTDVMHVNGVWELPDFYPGMVSRNTKCKVVYCPRGGLSDAALHRGKRIVKWLMWHFGGQWRALKSASMFHAASMKELHEIRALGLKQPIALIPNGIDVPNVRHKRFTAENRKIVFFGRIHVTKAADHLVEAWRRVAALFPQWSLEIAGPDCGAVPALQKRIEEQSIPRVRFVGELRGDEKYDFLANADLYVLPSLTENFGITIAEALACGTPVMASKGCPWEGVVEKCCGWWVDIGPDALERQLREVLAMSPRALMEMGERGRSWMTADYVWDGVGRKMLAAYEWLAHGGSKPEYIYEV